MYKHMAHVYLDSSILSNEHGLYIKPTLQSAHNLLVSDASSRVKVMTSLHADYPPVNIFTISYEISPLP